MPLAPLLLLAGPSTPALLPAQAGRAHVGETVPDFRFGEFLTGDDGRLQLSEFHGQPVLIVNWTDSDFGRGAADDVRKTAQALVPEGLVVVLRDTHNRSADEILASAMRRYPGSPARFVRNLELPIEYEDDGPPPDVALIDVEGRLLVAGSYTVDLRRAEKLVEAELERRRRGWGETDAVREARALAYGKDRLGAAMARCEAALAEEPTSAELLGLRDELTAQVAWRERAVRHHVDRGECLLAHARLEELTASVAGRPEWEASARALETELSSPEVARELDQDERLATLLKPLLKKAPKASDVRKLERFAEEAGETRVGKRARELARLAALVAD